MLTLALDTALQACSVAIVRDGAPMAVVASPLVKGHAERIAPMVRSALAEAGVEVASLDRIGVVVGPGGFTGVRVGLAFARSLSLGVKAEVVGVNSLKALSIMVKGAALVAPVIDARRGQVYAALYDDAGKELLAPFVAAPEAALRRLRDAAGGKATTSIGSGAALIGAEGAGWEIFPGDGQIDVLTLARFCACAAISDHPPAPLYLRPPDAKAAGPSLFEMASRP